MEILADLVGVGMVGLTVAAPVLSLFTTFEVGPQKAATTKRGGGDRAHSRGKRGTIDAPRLQAPGAVSQPGKWCRTSGSRAAAHASPSSPSASSTSPSSSSSSSSSSCCRRRPRRTRGAARGSTASSHNRRSSATTRSEQSPGHLSREPSPPTCSSSHTTAPCKPARLSGSTPAADTGPAVPAVLHSKPEAGPSTARHDGATRGVGVDLTTTPPPHPRAHQRGVVARPPAPSDASDETSRVASGAVSIVPTIGLGRTAPLATCPVPPPWNKSGHRVLLSTAEGPPPLVRSYTVTECQGPHPHWEDRHMVFEHGDRFVFGVFDGHGRRGFGHQASEFCSEFMRSFLTTATATTPVVEDVVGGAPSSSSDGHGNGDTGAAATSSPSSSPTATEATPVTATTAPPEGDLQGDLLGATVAQRRSTLRRAYSAADAAFLRAFPHHARHAGTTALVVAIGPTSLVVANAGDCRAVLCRSGKALTLTTDHKPSLRAEFERIVAAGGRIIRPAANGPLRVCSPDGRTGLAVSRGLGDHDFKDPRFCPTGAPLLSPEPDVVEVPLHRSGGVDEFVILASDGLWDVMDGQQAVDMVRAVPQPQLASNILAREATACGSQDNVTVVVVRL